MEMKMEDRKVFIKEFDNIGEIWGNGDESGRFEYYMSLYN